MAQAPIPAAPVIAAEALRDGGMCCCIWFDGKRLVREQINAKALLKA